MGRRTSTSQLSSLSSRQAVRHGIATKTASQRARFFRAKKDYFLPLLPEHNHIKRLVEKHMSDKDRSQEDQAMSGTADDEIHPYELIQEQPKGWVPFPLLPL